ncbi:hypothetical protein T02_14078 [Trichinella nativa]|uniref:Uncharacterized protein n=1 Tax=Trichinella nativa TaxID=6335 RepID=A0A0V1KHS5_9BILA|nr:hypothetical protein T02_14078 [Trichinella nativa]
MVAYFNLIFCVLIIGDTNYCSSTTNIISKPCFQ